MKQSGFSSLINKCSRFGWAAIAVVNLSPPAGWGAEAAPPYNPTNQTLTLDALVSEVLEHNPELNFYRAEIAAAKGERRTAATWANPELSTQLGHKQVRAPGVSDEGAAWSVSLQQTFEWPGRIALRKSIANQQVELAELGFAQFKSALTARARTLAFNLFAAQQKMSAAREVASRFEQLREVLVQRDPAGLTPVLETRIIEATELTLKRRSSEASLAAETGILELNQLRGQRWTNALTMQSLELVFVSAPELEALLGAARTNNFEIRMRQAELEQQGFKVSLAKKEGYPSFKVGPYFSQEKAGDRERQIGVALSVPLPLWNSNKGNVEAAAARQKQAETSMLVTQREVERRVVEHAGAYRTRLAEMAKWRAESVQEFRNAAELADRHYRLGAVPIATYVELQKQYLEAVEALLETKREALEAGQELQRLTGLGFEMVKMAAKEEKK